MVTNGRIREPKRLRWREIIVHSRRKGIDTNEIAKQSLIVVNVKEVIKVYATRD